MAIVRIGPRAAPTHPWRTPDQLRGYRALAVMSATENGCHIERGEDSLRVAAQGIEDQ
jgi:hypothetical protein